MQVKVITTAPFERWADTLEKTDHEAVIRMLGILEDRGVLLGYPHSSAIRSSRYALRELRIQSRGRPIRVFYAFDPARNVVLLLGGIKTAERRFYEKLIPQAEKVWEDYLEDQSNAEKETKG